MSVEKPDFSGLVKEHIPFTVIPNYVLQNVTYLEALGIWVHLISLPEDWDVNRAYLRSKFNLGREKLEKILKYLIDNYLIEYLWIRNADGTIKKVNIVVKNGNDFKDNIINNQLHNTVGSKSIPPVQSTILENHSLDKPLTGKTAPTKENNNYKENKKSSYKKANSKKHDFADSMNQMANEKRHIEEHEKRKAAERAPMPEELRSFYKKRIRKPLGYTEKLNSSGVH